MPHFAAPKSTRVFFVSINFGLHNVRDEDYCNDNITSLGEVTGITFKITKYQSADPEEYL